MAYPKWVTEGTHHHQRFELDPPDGYNKPFDVWVKEFYERVEAFIGDIERFHADKNVDELRVGHTEYGYSYCDSCGYDGDRMAGYSISVDLDYEDPPTEAQIEKNKLRYQKEREAAQKQTLKRKEDRKKQLAKTVKANKKQILEILEELDG